MRYQHQNAILTARQNLRAWIKRRPEYHYWFKRNRKYIPEIRLWSWITSQGWDK